MEIKFKVGDLVYYYKKHDVFTFDTIPCEIVKVNKKTLVLCDGSDQYKNIRLSSVQHQSEHPSFIKK